MRVARTADFNHASTCYILSGEKSESGCAKHPTNGASRAPVFPELRRSHFLPRLCLEVQSLNGRVHLSGPRGRALSNSRGNLARERFLHPGEDPEVALAPGTPRRRALDQALAELKADPKAKHPSTEWRREFSLLLGLERLLSEDEPKLADGTVLSAHQVDALSGTLAALLAEAQRRSAPDGNGRTSASASPELLASADILGPDGASSANGNEEL